MTHVADTTTDEAPVSAPGPATARERRRAAASAAAAPPDDTPSGPVAVAAVGDVPDHGMVPVSVGRRPVLLCRFGDDVFAVGAACTHQGAPLAEGRLDGALVRCPWHGALFDVRTGARVNVPTCADLRTYPVEVRDGTVWVTVAASA